MRLMFRSTRPGIAREGGSVHVEVTLDPGDRGGRPCERRHPLALCLVFDRSGSMGSLAGGWEGDRGPYPYSSPQRSRRIDCLPPPDSGDLPPHGRTKMDYVKAAAHALVDNLRDGDKVALVSFSHTGRVEMPMTAVSAWSRQRLHQTIACFRPEDSTNLYEGLVLGEREFGHAGQALPATHNCKIILLSDGLANVGVTSTGGMTDFALAAQRSGITVSALGVGLDYDAEVMGTLAQCGGGRFHHIAEVYRLPEIILAELESLAAVRARRVSLDVSAGPLVAIGENLNLYHQHPGPDGVRLDLGDLVGPKSVMFELSTPAGATGEHVPVRAVCRWADERGRERQASGVLALPLVSPEQAESLPVDTDLAEEVARLLEARASRLATGAYDAGDHARTLESLQRGLAELACIEASSPEMSPSAKAARTRLEGLRGRLERREVDAAEAKRLYSEGFDTTSGSAQPRNARTG